MWPSSFYEMHPGQEIFSGGTSNRGVSVLEGGGPVELTDEILLVLCGKWIWTEKTGMIEKVSAGFLDQ